MKKIDFPVINIKLVDIEKVVANDYNPNKVAKEELELLKISILEDGLTQPIVVYYEKNDDKYIIIDGFHRYTILKDFCCKEIPIVIIEKPLKDRMASTIRHNRARGKHQVDLLSELIKSLLLLGWEDYDIAKYLGMSAEEVLRLKQIIGIAKIFANKEYSKAWGESWCGNMEILGKNIQLTREKYGKSL
ncbi:MAG: IbrB-like domain-containing protein [Bacillota bacterium]